MSDGIHMVKRWIAQRIKFGVLRLNHPGSFDAIGRVDQLRPDLDVAVKLDGWMTLWKILLHPDPSLGEAYVDGRLTIEKGDLRALLELCFLNFRAVYVGQPLNRWGRFRRAAARALRPSETLRRARQHVSRHYDLSNTFYRLFLDSDMQYSCAYFPTSRLDLDQAQQAKKVHIMDKLLLRPGLRVLDIECGWGGLGLTLAREAGCKVKGVSLSTQQIALAQQRAREESLCHLATFVHEDYRVTDGRYDRIVSVGMLEHVGVRNYDEYFHQLARLLEDDGVALVHSIGRMDAPGSTSTWMRRYIFPGGHIPALSEIVAAAERAGLWITDVEILRLHYADTLKHWQDRFRMHRDQASVMFDERFCRMWEFYLISSEMAFRFDGLMVFQLQLARRIDVVPRTRDYLLPTYQAKNRRKSAKTTNVIPFNGA